MLNKSDLTPAQNEAIDRLYDYDETLLIARVGMGKCVIGLTAIQELLNDGVLKRVLVVAPLRVCDLTWATESAKWSHLHEPVAVATGSKAQREKVMKNAERIVVTNLENVKWMVEQHGDTFDGLLVDEMSKLKAVGGTSFRLLRSWVKGLKWRVGATATAVAESGTDIYGQALLLDLGKALGTRKEAFLRKYFYPTDYDERKWELHEALIPELVCVLSALVFVADDGGYEKGLPALKETVVRVPMSETHKALYGEMQTHSVIEVFGDPIVAATAAVQYGKLHQIASGGLYDNDGKLVWQDYDKISRMMRYISEAKSPVVVVYQYQFQRDELARRYPEAPILGGGERFTAEDQAAWNRGETPVLIMHPKSAAAGLNLQHGGNVMYYLSPIASADLWQQSIGRLRRRGSPYPHVHRVVFIAEGTVDEAVLGMQTGKLQNEKALMAALSGV